ncbi:MAG: hypothetical protein ACOYMR_12475 [Ilumatobacteraceae bacterium]|jgi:hypothetical protein
MTKGRTNRLLTGIVASAALVALGACSADGGAAGGSTSTPTSDGGSGALCQPTGTTQAPADLPQVADIATAVTDLEAELGGSQQYFEINATARVVNLFVALNEGKLAQPWIWLDGQLSSKEGQPASGGTFTAADMDFDPDAIFTIVRDQIPDAILETFYVNGDGTGNVQYGLLTSAQCGGGLDIVVGPDGAVKSVDPVN